MGVVGDSAGQIHDKACMVVDVELVTLELARSRDGACCTEDILFAAIDHLVGAGIVGVAVLHHIIRVQVVLQVGVGQAVRGDGQQVGCLAVGLLPAGIHVLGLDGLLGQVTVLAYIIDQLRGVVGAVLALDAGPPAKVVQAVVPHIQILRGLAHNVAHAAQSAHRHVADVDDLCMGTQYAAGFCHDGCGVGIVEHPAVGAVLFHVVDQLHDVGNAAHAVGNAAGNAMTSRMESLSSISMTRRSRP